MSIEQVTQSFLSEAAEILEDLEERLLALEDDPAAATVDAIFRALHTVKGSGAMFGFSELSGFAHHFETEFEAVRSGQRPVTGELVGAALAACDVLTALLSLPPGSDEARQTASGPRAQAALEALSCAPGDETGGGADEDAGGGRTASPATWRVTYRPAPSDLRNGARPDLLVAELLELGTGTARPLPDRVPRLENLDPEESTLAWVIEVGGEIGRSDIEDVFVFSDAAEIAVECLSDPEDEAAPAAAEHPPAHRASESGIPDSPMPPAPQSGAPRRTETRTDTLRVPAARIDDMMDALGELVIAQSRLSQAAVQFRDASLDGAIEEVERLVLSLRDSAMSMRMLPVETVFGKFRRVVRDLSRALGKEAELETRGGETEVDKNVLDRLTDPLVHMLRNALDHGLELPEDRLAAGKPRQGTVRLSARQEGGDVVLEISDDGQGLNAERIRARAIERGLLSPDEEPAEAEVLNFIFAPGFSTAQTISDVSGRGVGMDAVREAVDMLGGTVSVASKPGLGARVTLRLPVSLAIIDGLRVRLGGQVCVVPLSAVDECVEMPTGALARASGRRSIDVRDELVPVIPLEDILGWTAASGNPLRRVVVVRAGGRRTGLVVDDILGQAQIVVKPLTALHRTSPAIAGATILGDGSVALILDAAGALQTAQCARKTAA